jgi:hypothetical protein
MIVGYIKIFADEMVMLETSDGSLLLGIIQSSKNNFDHFENYPTDIQELQEMVITVRLKSNYRLDLAVKMSDIQSIERIE